MNLKTLLSFLNFLSLMGIESTNVQSCFQSGFFDKDYRIPSYMFKHPATRRSSAGPRLEVLGPRDSRAHLQ